MKNLKNKLKIFSIPVIIVGVIGVGTYILDRKIDAVGRGLDVISTELEDSSSISTGLDSISAGLDSISAGLDSLDKQYMYLDSLGKIKQYNTNTETYGKNE